jgi:dynein heavy chain
MKVKLCSVGYEQFEMLSQKFFVLYNTSKEQLSAQKHYDWGLRNILAVLRTGGQTKRGSYLLFVWLLFFIYALLAVLSFKC